MSHVVQSVVRNRRRELETLKRDISKLEAVKPPFPRITYDEAIEILQAARQSREVGRRPGRR